MLLSAPLAAAVAVPSESAVEKLSAVVVPCDSVLGKSSVGSCPSVLVHVVDVLVACCMSRSVIDLVHVRVVASVE